MRRSERRLRRDPGRPRLPPVGRLGTPIAASPAEREAARRCRIPSYCPSLSGLAPTCGCPQELLAVASGKAAGLVPTPSLRKALGTLCIHPTCYYRAFTLPLIPHLSGPEK